MSEVEFRKSLSAERSLLGGVLIDPTLYPGMRHLVEPEHFYSEKYGRLWHLMGEMYQTGTMPDMVLVGEAIALAGDQRLPTVADTVRLSDHCPSTKNLGYYARSVHQHWQLRAAQQQLAKLHEIVSRDPMPERALSALQAEMGALQKVAMARTEQRSDGYSAVQEHRHIVADRAAIGQGSIICAESSLSVLNVHRIYRAGSLNLLAGDSQAGKTSLTCQEALQVARRAYWEDVHDGNGRPILDDSGKPLRRRVRGRGVLGLWYECPRHEMVGKAIAQEARIPTSRVNEAQLRTFDDEARIAEAERHVEALPIEWVSPNTITDTADKLRMYALAAQASFAALDVDLALIIVDYIQLIPPGRGIRVSDWAARADHDCRHLKQLAKDLNCAVLAISHVAKTSAEREGRPISLYDLAGGRSIGRMADSVLALEQNVIYGVKGRYSKGLNQPLEWDPDTQAFWEPGPHGADTGGL